MKSHRFYHGLSIKTVISLGSKGFAILQSAVPPIGLTPHDPCGYLCSLRLDLLSLQIFLDGCDPLGESKFKLDYIACTLHLYSKLDTV